MKIQEECSLKVKIMLSTAPWMFSSRGCEEAGSVHSFFCTRWNNYLPQLTTLCWQKVPGRCCMEQRIGHNYYVHPSGEEKKFKNKDLSLYPFCLTPPHQICSGYRNKTQLYFTNYLEIEFLNHTRNKIEAYVYLQLTLNY